MHHPALFFSVCIRISSEDRIILFLLFAFFSHIPTQRNQNYNVVSRELETDELKALIDAVLASRYLSVEKSRHIVSLLVDKAAPTDRPYLEESLDRIRSVRKALGRTLYSSDLISQWMGESERKMKEALEFVDNVAPCVLWVDEIEKALSVSHGESDTGKRILGQFLFWLQESTSRVFLVATANNVDLLPPELFRKGRFSEVFFVDVPNAAERREVINQYVCDCLHVNLMDSQLSELVGLSQGFSYSEIEYAVKEVAQLLFLHGPESINMESFRSKFRTVVPIEKSRPEDVKRIREWGQERAVPAFKNENGGEN